ncbi:MAG: universal stress protein [Aquificae bacterium]|nr:universal stress protein [Aquificota bacterium]
MEIKKVLVCVDLTPVSLKALEWAKMIAEKFSAELVVFHELEDVYTILKTSVSFGLPAMPDLKEKEEKKVIDNLKPLLKDIQTEYRFLIEAKGKTEDRLVEITEEEKQDITVIPTGYEKVITKINSQVLVIK